MGLLDRLFNNSNKVSKEVEIDYEEGYEDGYEDGYGDGQVNVYGSLLRKEGSSEAGRQLANHRWGKSKEN
ncbi:hypothetical protein QWY22_03660 [Planococcus liqunii]|uniref:hypothetical protein n=1 Tax=Planococcus liqunii TaxID=3058394 RepID=UPI0026231F70|nr:hypothetical protein [Planococcus sp. N056]WKA51713.1 hypothetical protein QWY22_03660 [Planococcus sp. N056]